MESCSCALGMCILAVSKLFAREKGVWRILGLIMINWGDVVREFC